MTHLDLCSGIGGFHLAAEWAGFQTAGFAEVDPFCCKLLAEKWPDIKNYGDLRTADFSELRGRIDVLSAGVPCQPASLAGKRGGSGDHRWLWDAVLDVTALVRPTYAIYENPVGILTLDEFGGILLRLESFGYAVRAFSVPANAVGAKHRRQRVFIVANRNVERLERSEYVGQRNGELQQLEHMGSQTLANADGDRREQRREVSGLHQGERDQLESTERSQTLADADSAGRREHLRPEPVEPQLGPIERDVRQFRLTQPPLCRRADGVPDRSHRLKALGNSVVPQQAYPFFEAIAQVYANTR